MIYFAFCTGTGFTKIGYSERDVQRRLSAVQTGNPHPLHLLGVLEGEMPREKALHALFQSRRMEGEWFRLNLNDLVALGVLPPNAKMPEHTLKGVAFGPAGATPPTPQSLPREPTVVQQHVHVTPSPDRLIRGYQQVHKEFGISPQAWKRLISEGRAPKPLFGAGKGNCWVAKEIEAALRIFAADHAPETA